MTAAAPHALVRRATLALAATLAVIPAIGLASAALAHARTIRPHIAFVRCSSVPYPCPGRTVVVRTGRLLVGATGMSSHARVVFAVRPRGRRAGYRGVGGTLRTRTRIVVRVPGDAVSGRIWVVNPGRRTSNAVRITVRRPPRLSHPSGQPSVFDGDGMWIWYLSKSQGGDPTAIAAQARAHGIETIFVKSADGVNVWSQFSAANVAALKATGLHVCAWQFVYGSDPLGEAAAGAVAAQNGADCFVIDAEGAYEGKYAQAQRYMAALRKAVGPAYPIGLTSFPYVDYHPAFPYSVFLAAGNATFNLPQVYWKTIGDPVDASVAHTYDWNTPYVTPIFPLGQTYDSPPPGDVVRFRELSAAYGARGLSWWDWQETSDAGWSAVGAPLSPLSVAPPTPPTLRAGAGGKVGSRGDLVVWAQEHLIGAGQQIAADGAYGGGTARAVSAFQASAGLPLTGQVDAATWPALLRVTPVAPDWTASAKASAASAGGRSGPPSAWLPARRDEVPPGPG
jgi:putative peptidoglycan binding protein